ncbi:MAG: glycosyltransferase [Anaerolineae bacterium]
MKIAVITSSFPRFRGDGVGSFIYSLMSSLVGLGHEVTVLAPDDPQAVVGWQSEVRVKRVRFIRPGAWSRLGHAHSLAGDVKMKWHAYPLVALFTLFAVFELRREVRRQRSDVIYAQWLVPGGFIGAIVSRLTGVPLVVAVHGSDVFVAERQKILRPAISFILRTARSVIACSGDLARRVSGLGLSKDRIVIVPYGVDIERYKPNAAARQSLSSSMPIPSDQDVVMVMGRLVPKKGFAYFVEAIPAVLSLCPTTTFLVAGEGKLRAEMESIASSLAIREHIFFAGHVPWEQTPKYLALADVLVIPSIVDEAGNIDGLPNVLLESMACGCAIVATDVAGIPEVVHHNDNGLLVPQKDKAALARAICMLLKDPSLRQRLGTQARLTVVGGLTWTHIGERIVQLLKTCVQEAS